MSIFDKIQTPESKDYKARIAELEKENRQLKFIVSKLKQENDSLQNIVKAMESKIAKLLKNSSNSSKPPSSDDITKPKKKKSSKKNKDKKRKIGGQPGHPKNERKPFESHEIDELYEHYDKRCPHCGSDEIVVHLDKTRTVQQVEIVEFPIVKSEHISYGVWCKKCKKFHYMPIPANVIRDSAHCLYEAC